MANMRKLRRAAGRTGAAGDGVADYLKGDDEFVFGEDVVFDF